LDRYAGKSRQEVDVTTMGGKVNNIINLGVGIDPEK